MTDEQGNSEQPTDDGDYADCPQCRDLPEDTTPLAEAPRMAHDVTAVMSYPGVVQETPHKHNVDRAGVVLPYAIGQMIPCSLRGRHAHKSGAVARTRCGILIRLGNRCAERSTKGWAQAQAHWEETIERAQRRGAVFDGRDFLSTAHGILDRLVGTIDRVNELLPAEGYIRWARFQRKAQGSIPPFVEEVSELSIPRGRNFVPGSETTRTVEKKSYVSGEAFWDGWDNDGLGQKRRIEESRRLVEVLTSFVGLDLKDLTDEELAKAAQDSEAARKYLGEQKSWCDLAALFFNRDNLELVQKIRAQH